MKTYPFRILIVRRDDRLMYRIVYQEPNIQPLVLDTPTGNIHIRCSAMPELSIHKFSGTMYLRGHDEFQNHCVNTYDGKRITDEEIQLLNNKLKNVSV